MSISEFKQSDDTTTFLKKEEMKEDMKEMDDGEVMASISNAISGDKIKELLSSQGPTVKAVLLKSDGSVEEISYDSTPSRNHVSEILGAPPSIIGQYPDLDVIVVGPRYQEPQTEFKLNKHKLRFPFNNSTFYGDVFLYKFNQDCVCVDFTADQYKAFAAKSHEDIGKVFEPLISDDQDVQDDDEYDEEEYNEEDAQYAEDFMREIIMNKVKKEYPEKFGREPTEQELEDMVNATLSMFAGGIQEEDDEEYVDEEYQDEEDAEYDPNDDQHQAMNDEICDIPNDDELKTEKQDIEQALEEEAEPLKDVLDEDEEKLVNSEHFENELVAAIEMVQNIAKFDKEKILTMTRELYKTETGMEPTNEMMDDALKLFTMDNQDDVDENVDDDQEEETHEADIDGEEFKKEMEMALENVRKLGSAHQQEFVNQICKTYTELNGVEPTEEQISGIFGRIKEKLADEARDQFLEDNGNDNDQEDENDDDYVPNEQDVKQVEDDKKMDLLEELVENNDDDNVDEDDKTEPQKVKILVTPVKKRLSGSRVDIYLKDQPDANKTLDIASSKFEQINGRAPNDNDTQRLKEFLTTGMLFESEVNTSKTNSNDIDDEEEDDEDYDPTKDTFDYSKDIEEDQFDVADENNDTSNMIDID
eukprot:CAMPEP_0201568990 /NCGR_PEP_ID=MMETSP0190_2-20130828/10412_1 /ASSEMBLY_ACC=CAM_ASM_000263 /TAXON_ID=37353 /ORGANISM="Rosalina sp." /LENGTH=644 /DNA_ID=CAMNT_0047990807 /DNA_START=80 /DNA_END=2014 /DNA_ORIENTATION=-